MRYIKCLHPKYSSKGLPAALYFVLNLRDYLYCACRCKCLYCLPHYNSCRNTIHTQFLKLMAFIN